MNNYQTLATDTAKIQRGALSRKDAANYLSISTRLLDQLARDGRLVRAKIGWKSVFLLEDLDAFLQSCRQVTNSKSMQPKRKLKKIE